MLLLLLLLVVVWLGWVGMRSVLGVCRGSEGSADVEIEIEIEIEIGGWVGLCCSAEWGWG